MLSMPCLLALSAALATGAPKQAADLWVLKPVVRPQVPAGVTRSANPIDAFIATQYQAKGLRGAAAADKFTLLRRVYLDLIGIPPTPAEQDAFLADQSPDAYEKVVDRLLASEQHGVRYARHWLDVLRYADQDERMIAAPGIHYWRDWVISALNADVPYDQFVRAMLTGYRTNERTTLTSTGYRVKLEPRPEDMFAQGFLARGDVIRDGHEVHEMPMAAVETVSTAFMGLTVGCAKCHDHMYDPISQRDFYAMKALFDPLDLRKVTLASPEQILANLAATTEQERKRAAVEGPLNALIAPYQAKLYEERVAMLPDDVKAVIRKPEKKRTPAEMKIADDYYPILRIDSDKLLQVMPDEDKKRYKELQGELQKLGGGRGFGRGGGGLPAFWTVEVNPKLEMERSYILTSGDFERPEKDKPVIPGWPFMPKQVDWSNGRIGAFAEWLTAPENPMFARVAINRIWQWHFGEGLQRSASDFGTLGGKPSNPALLDWLASEFVARKFSMKEMDRLIVTSDTYKMASQADAAVAAANNKADPDDTWLWRFRLERLDAEPLWDSILAAAGTLDTAVGGPSFDPGGGEMRRRGAGRGAPMTAQNLNRRGAYMIRGFSPSQDMIPVFLQAFDVDDGRAPCPLRTQTVTAPQSLFLMNSDVVDKASVKLAERLRKEAGEDIDREVTLAYRITLNRPPSAKEKDLALSYVQNDPDKLKNFAWLLFNLDEFLFVK
jgi:hypothetical protein